MNKSFNCSFNVAVPSTVPIAPYVLHFIILYVFLIFVSNLFDLQCFYTSLPYQFLINLFSIFSQHFVATKFKAVVFTSLIINFIFEYAVILAYIYNWSVFL